MHDLSLRQLRTFIDVSQTGNLGQSANNLFITRGAVSQAIKSLESTLGFELFDRSQQLLLTNSHGHQLLPLAKEMLAKQEAIFRLFADNASLEGLRLGASHTIGNYLLAEILSQEAHLPQVTLANSQELQQALLKYELDIALIESSSISKGLEKQLWLEDEMIVICSNQHPLANKTVECSELENQPWVLREATSGSREQFDRHLAPMLNEYRVVLEYSSLQAVIHAAQQGIALSLVSHLACRSLLEAGTLSKISLASKIKRRFHIVYPKNNASLAQVQYLLNKLTGLQTSA